MTKNSNVTLEDTLARLEALISTLEEDGASLEDSLAAFEQGVKLTREAQAVLLEAEQRVQLLMEKDGALTAKPLQIKDEE
jgi:exodeoxyribonuclease VII small subunit